MGEIGSSVGSSSQPTDGVGPVAKKTTAGSSALSAEQTRTLNTVNTVASDALHLSSVPQKAAWRKVTAQQLLRSLTTENRSSGGVDARESSQQVVHEVKSTQSQLQNDSSLERHYESSLRAYAERYPLLQQEEKDLLSKMKPEALLCLLQEVKQSGHLESGKELLTRAANYVQNNRDHLRESGCYESLRKEVVELGKTVDMLARMSQQTSVLPVRAQTVTNLTRSKAKDTELKTDPEIVQKLGAIALGATQGVYKKLAELPEKPDLQTFERSLQTVDKIQPHIQEFLQARNDNATEIESYSQCLELLSAKLTTLIETHKGPTRELKACREQIDAVRVELNKDGLAKDIAEISSRIEVAKTLQHALKGLKSDSIEYKIGWAKMVFAMQSVLQCHDNCSSDNRKSFRSELKKEIQQLEKAFKQNRSELPLAALYKLHGELQQTEHSLLGFLASKGLARGELDDLSIDELDTLKARLTPEENSQFDSDIGILRMQAGLIKRTYSQLEKADKERITPDIQTTLAKITVINSLDADLRIRGYEKLYQKCIDPSPPSRREHEKDVCAFLKAMKNSASEQYRARYPTHTDEVYLIADENDYELDL